MASAFLFQALPCYTLLLDKWYDGEPDNNDFFKTQFEWDLTETQLRYGGDAKGLMNPRSLDYLQGMGVKSLYIAGTPWLNMPWQADSASSRFAHHLARIPAYLFFWFG